MEEGTGNGEEEGIHAEADRGAAAARRGAVGQGKTVQQACREAGTTEQSYYRWRKEYGGLQLDQAKRLKELEKENSRLKRLAAELSLEKAMLKEIASGNF